MRQSPSLSSCAPDKEGPCFACTVLHRILGIVTRHARAHTGHRMHCCAQGAPADMAPAAGAHTRVHAPLPRARALCGLRVLLS